MQWSIMMQMGGLIVLGGLFLACSILGSCQIYIARKKIAVSKSWPQTMGRVNQASVRLKHTVRAGRHYLTEVAYAYSVLGVEYSGTFIVEPFWSFGTKPSAERDLSQYPAGTPVPIRYNPENPQHHVTEHDGVTAGSVILTIFFIFLTTATFYFLILSRS